MQTITNIGNIGSLALQPKDRHHVHGDGDDGTTTRWDKARMMTGGIDLRSPISSWRRHERSRQIVGYALVAVFAALTLYACWLAWPAVRGWL